MNNVRMIGDFRVKTMHDDVILIDYILDLPTVILPDEVTHIEAYAFEKKQNLTTIECSANSNLQKISSKAFWNCPKLCAFIIPNTLEHLPINSLLPIKITILGGGKNIFRIICQLKLINSVGTILSTDIKVYLKGNFLELINSNSLYDYKETLTRLSKISFFWENDNYKVINFEITRNMLSIRVLKYGDENFDLILPIGVSFEKAIAKCEQFISKQNNNNAKASKKIQTNKIHQSVVEKNETINNRESNDYIEINQVLYIYIRESNSYSVVGANITTNKKVEILNKINDIPVTTIRNAAFKDNLNVYDLFIPNTITTIEDDAFNSCVFLTRINSEEKGVYNINDSISYIGNRAFANCIHLRSIRTSEYGSKLTSVGLSVFYNCYSMVECELPKSLKTIRQNIFVKCSSLVRLKVSSELKDQMSYFFTKKISVKYIENETRSIQSMVKTAITPEVNKKEVIDTISNIDKQKMIKCNRCNGSGYLPQYRHIMDGVCFACGGKGYII